MDLDLKIATTFNERQSYLRRKVPHVSALTTLFLYYPHICANSHFVRQTDGSQYIYKRTDPCIPLNTITAPLIMEMEEYFKSLIPASMQVTDLQWTHESNKYTVRFQFCDRTDRWVEISAYSVHKPTAMALLLARCGKSDRFQALSSSAARAPNKRPMPTTRERLVGAASDMNTVKQTGVAVVEKTPPVVQDSNQSQHHEVRYPAQLTATISAKDILQYMPYTLGRALHSIFAGRMLWTIRCGQRNTFVPQSNHWRYRSNVPVSVYLRSQLRCIGYCTRRTENRARCTSECSS